MRASSYHQQSTQAFGVAHQEIRIAQNHFADSTNFDDNSLKHHGREKKWTFGMFKYIYCVASSNCGLRRPETPLIFWTPPQAPPYHPIFVQKYRIKCSHRRIFQIFSIYFIFDWKIILWRKRNPLLQITTIRRSSHALKSKCEMEHWIHIFEIDVVYCWLGFIFGGAFRSLPYIIAIDFGTSGTACAYALTPEAIIRWVSK